MTELPQNFWDKVNKTDDCWLWTAHTSNGYGTFTIPRQGRKEYAHRVAYKAFVGPIPDGLQIDHLCFNNGCVNPSHLEAVTLQENATRSMLRNAVIRNGRAA